MNKLIEKQFELVCHNTYHPFEIYDKQAIKYITGTDLTYRDLQILNVIDKLPANATPSFLSETILVHPSALSNALKSLEKRTYIKRTKSETDARIVMIHILPKAKEIVSEYDRYVSKFNERVRSETSLLEIPLATRVFKKLKEMILANSSVSILEDLAPDEFSVLFLFELHSLFMQPEIDLLEESTPKLELRDAFGLSELYMYQTKGGQNYTEYAHNIGINYQTVMSKLKKFERDGLLLKERNGHYIFSEELSNLLRHYMKLRIIIYYDTMSNFTEREQNYILTVFQAMKDNALDYIKQHEDLT